MVLCDAKISHHAEPMPGIHVVRAFAPAIARAAKAGQFVNLRLLDGTWGPLLRRPFSISRIHGEEIELLFNVIGTGTTLLANKRAGDSIDMLGPLGKPFASYGQFETALLVGGGLGVAPLPLLTHELQRARKKILTFLGARTKMQLYLAHLESINVATDDGSEGFHGTNVQLLNEFLSHTSVHNPKIFACGPTPMLRAVSDLAKKRNLPCELSLESEMACGVGICQGCAVERASGEKKYGLVCTDGPTFECREIVLSW